MAAPDQDIETGLLPAVVQLAEALRSGLSIEPAMEAVGKSRRGRISEEFGRVVAEVNKGRDLEHVLPEMKTRLDHEDVDYLVAGILITRRAGGSLATILDGISDTLRERARLRGLIRSLTSQGRLTAYVLTAIPCLIGLMMFWKAPATTSKLWTWAGEGFNPLNALPLLYCVVSIIAGYLWIKKIMTIDY